MHFKFILVLSSKGLVILSFAFYFDIEICIILSLNYVLENKNA